MTTDVSDGQRHVEVAAISPEIICRSAWLQHRTTGVFHSKRAGVARQVNLVNWTSHSGTVNEEAIVPHRHNGLEIVDHWGGYAGEVYGLGQEPIIQCK
jgi:hypothetical protein